MSIPEEKLVIPRWTGATPERIEKKGFVIGHNTDTAIHIDPPIILAPMAAITNAPYRKLCRELGAGMVVTEMVAATQLIAYAKKSRELLDLRDDESPVCVQLFGKRPDELAAAAAICEEAGADAVDLNMGCPMRKVVGSGHGAALLRTPALVEKIYQAMSQAVSIPVTGKIRAGFEDVNAVDVAQAIEQGGGSAITIHGRTRCAKYEGHADLSVIADLKTRVSIPVIGNGDVRDYISSRRMFTSTQCDGVMVARGCLGNPWVFTEIKADLEGKNPFDVANPLEQYIKKKEEGSLSTEDASYLMNKFRCTILRHVDLYIETFGIELTARQIRKHLVWYFRDSSAESIIRNQLKHITNRDHIIDAIDQTIAALTDES